MRLGRIHNEGGSPAPRDLREVDGRAGRTYPVDPAAVARLQRILAEREGDTDRPDIHKIRRQKIKHYDLQMTDARKRRAAESRWGIQQKEQDVTAAAEQVQPIPETDYPAEVVAEAKRQNEKDPKFRNLKRVFTPEVCDVLWFYHTANNRSFEWLAEHNGLVRTTGVTIARYMKMHPPTVQEAEEATPAKPADPFAGVANGRPYTNGARKNGSAQTAVAEMASQIDDPRLRSLVRLMQSGSAEFTGTVTFDLKVKVSL